MIALLARFLLARNPAMTTAYARRLAKVGLIVGAVVLVVAGLWLWAHLHTKAAVEADRNAAKAEAVSRAREADERAQRASTGAREAIERSNADAQAAADRSDDPLRAGLDELRNRQR